jgi:hypothetical protein
MTHAADHAIRLSVGQMQGVFTDTEFSKHHFTHGYGWRGARGRTCRRRRRCSLTGSNASHQSEGKQQLERCPAVYPVNSSLNRGGFAGGSAS